MSFLSIASRRLYSAKMSKRRMAAWGLGAALEAALDLLAALDFEAARFLAAVRVLVAVAISYLAGCVVGTAVMSAWQASAHWRQASAQTAQCSWWWACV